MNLEIELLVVGSTDKMVRFDVKVSGQSAGELLTTREDFTKIAEKFFDGIYLVSKGKQATALSSDAVL